MSKHTEMSTSVRAERAVVRSVIRALRQAGFELGYHDGEELVAPMGSNEAALMAEVQSTDEARLYFRDDVREVRGSIVLVYGNSPWEVCSDWSSVEPASSIIWKVVDRAAERLA